MKKVSIMLIVGLMTVLLAACGEPSVSGIVIDKTDYDMIVAENLTEAEYEEIKDISPDQLQTEDIEGKRDSLGLYQVEYDKMEDIEIGQKIEAWTNENSLALYPLQLKASKVKVIE